MNKRFDPVVRGRVGTLFVVDVNGKSFVGVGVCKRTSMESSERGEVFVDVGVREGT